MTDLTCYRCKSQPCKCADGTTLYLGDCRDMLAGLPEKHFHCCVTSPPYYALRDYQCEGQIGLEKTPDEYVAKMVEVFRGVWRTLRDDGVCWINIGDSYVNAGGPGTGGNLGRINRAYQQRNYRSGIPDKLKSKDLLGMPWRLAFALQADEWYLRDAVVWHKPSPMPGSQRDRCTSAYEFVFQLTKRARYFFDAEAIKEKTTGNTHSRGTKRTPPIEQAGIGHKDWCKYMTRDDEIASRIPRNVWTIVSEGYPGAHFATMPGALAEKCIKAATSEKGCCPECGAPWRRIVEKERVPTRPGMNTKIKVPGGWDTSKRSHGSFHQDGRGEPEYRELAEVGNRDPQRHTTETRTVGWKPTCECYGPKRPASSDTTSLPMHLKPVPCRVLDPFGGAGTTALAAIGLQRHCTLIELSREYCELTVQRLREGLYPKRTKREDLPGQKLMEFADES